MQSLCLAVVESGETLKPSRRIDHMGYNLKTTIVIKQLSIKDKTRITSWVSLEAKMGETL